MRGEVGEGLMAVRTVSMPSASDQCEVAEGNIQHKENDPNRRINQQ